MTALSALASIHCLRREAILALAILWLDALISSQAHSPGTFKATSARSSDVSLTSSHQSCTQSTTGSPRVRRRSKCRTSRASVIQSTLCSASIQEVSVNGTRNSKLYRSSPLRHTCSACRRTAPSSRCTRTLLTHRSRVHQRSLKANLPH
mgnify:CR=1 FL=1